MTKLIVNLPNKLRFYMLLVLFPIQSSAQKLPDIQKHNLRAPIDVKIDGNVNEWGEFQAYNHNTDIFYTVANDDKNLYLVVQAKDDVIIKKIIGGGITLYLCSVRKKNDKDRVSIAFPFLADSVRDAIAMSLNLRMAARNEKEFMKKADSLIFSMNHRLIGSAKEISITGVKTIEDSILSVYNDLGINAAMRFDKFKSLNYELSIPLKYLPSFAQNHLFYYNIKLNGLFSTRDDITIYPAGSNVIAVVSIPTSMAGKGAAAADIIDNQTDFWGEYVLKK
ncbi:hypothetical protein [uncultured Mucilaginibacter sp.]|uniref:hypothetical protein n=1 Tax=uncultured Mucilaginibacter sp. TaxID=797541 RepID=UPI0025EBC979|nr:hypothetical protein [uncultured Mucilaginibacter sp.]